MKKIFTWILLTVLLGPGSKCLRAQTWQPVGNNDFNQYSYNYTAYIDYNPIAFKRNSGNHVAYIDAITGDVTADGNTLLTGGLVHQVALAVSYYNFPYMAYINASNNNSVQVMDMNANAPLGNEPLVSGANYVDISIYNLQTPFVIFDDSANQHRATAMKFTGNKWVYAGNPGFSQGAISSPQLSVTPPGYPLPADMYAIFSDSSLGNMAVVMDYNGNWFSLGTVSQGAVTQGESIVLDGNTNPLIAFVDEYNGTQGITVQSLQGGSWQTLGTEQMFDGIHPALSINDNGIIFLAFTNRTTHNAEMWQYTNNTWQQVGPGPVALGAYNVCMGIAQGDSFPYIAYINDGDFEDFYGAGVHSGDQALKVKTLVNGNWQIQGDTEFSSSDAWQIALTMWRDTPYVAYADLSQDLALTVRKFNGTSWQLLGPAGFNQYESGYPAITTDNYGHPYVTYVDTGGTHISTFNGTAWIFAGGEDYKIPTILYSALISDTAGNIYLAYTDYAYGNRASVLKYNGSSWANVGNPGFSNIMQGTLYGTSMAISNSGVLYIAYVDSSAYQNISVMKYDNGSWQVVGNSDFALSGSNRPIIKIDNNGVPYVCYLNYASGITVVKLQNNVWTPLGDTAALLKAYVGGFSFTIDKFGFPILAYQDYKHLDNCSVIKYNGQQWVYMGKPGFTAGFAYWIQVVTDSLGLPLVVDDETGAFAHKFDGIYSIGNNDTICTGDSIVAGDSVLRRAGNYYFTYVDIYGRDSTQAWFISVLPPTVADTIYASVCPGGSFQVGNKSYKNSGTYTDTLQTVHGCDSIVTLFLTLSAAQYDTITKTICQFDTVYIGQTPYTQSGFYTDTLQEVSGCDSIVSLNLTVTPVPVDTSYYQVCFGDSAFFSGKYYYNSGSYLVLKPGSGCGTASLLNLTVLPGFADTSNVSICAGDSFNFNGSYCDTAGFYTQTFHNINGCDSSVTLHLAVLQPVTISLNDTICGGDTVYVGNTPFTTSGNYTTIVSGMAGCDSTVVLNLIVNQTATNTLNAGICAGDTFYMGNKAYFTGGTFADTLQNAGGCDSIVVLTLTINPLPMVTLSWDSMVILQRFYLFYPNDTGLCGAIPYFVLLTGGLPAGGTFSGRGVDGDSLILGNIYGKFDTIAYTFIDNNGCKGTSTDTAYMDLCESIQSINSDNAISIYPNPASNLLYIKTEGLHAENILIYDVDGQVVAKQAFTPELDIHNLTPGVYLLEVNSVEGVARKRWVKM